MVELERIVDALPQIAAIELCRLDLHPTPAGTDHDRQEQQWLELCRRFMRRADWSG